MKIKIFKIFFLTVAIIGGYAFFLSDNSFFKPSQPAYLSYNGQRIEAVGQADLTDASLRNKKLKTTPERPELIMRPDLKASPLMNPGQSNSGKAETLLLVNGNASNNSSRNRKTDQGNAEIGNSVMIAGMSRSRASGSAGSSQYAAMAVQKVTVENTSINPTQSAPNGTEANNEDDPPFPGDPGQMPVGDGLWFLLGSVAVYALLKRRNLK